MIIRPETLKDIKQIEKIIVAAFQNHSFGSHNEHLIVNRLRKDGALSVSLVAELDEKLIGHITFSPVTIAGKNISWYGLGPVAVKPSHQKQGIGSRLILDGLEAIKKMSAEGCVLLGEPAYYSRFGFKAYPNLILANVPPEYFQALSFSGTIPSGEVVYDPAFSANS